MLKRYSIAKGRDQLLQSFQVSIPSGYKPIYNAAPSHSLPVITNQQPDKLQYFQWGLLPYNAKDQFVGDKLINARIETLKAKAPFADLLPTQRCLILADGFFVWEGDEPHRVTMKSGELFAIAGIWDRWQDEFDESTYFQSFSMITTPAVAPFRSYADRMPSILSPDEAKAWLAAETTVSDALSLLKPFPEELLKVVKVSNVVNNENINTPEAIKDAEVQNPGESFNLFS